MNLDDEILKEAVGNLIQSKREALQISREEFARLTVKSPNTLYFIEKGGTKKRGDGYIKGRNQITLANFIQFSYALNSTPDQMMKELVEKLKEMGYGKTDWYYSDL